MSEEVATIPLPPCDLEVERLVVGAALLHGRLDAVEPKHFFYDCHRRIYEAIDATATHPLEHPICQVARRLRRDDRIQQVGGTPALVELLDPYVDAEHVDDRIAWLVEYWRRRVIHEVSRQLQVELVAGELSGAEAWRRFKGVCEEVAAGYTASLPTTLSAQTPIRFEGEAP